MSNPNPNPATRFGVEGGNTPGRKHTKDKLSQQFMRDLQEVWTKEGKGVIERLAAGGDLKANAALAKIVAGMEPKQVEHTKALDAVDDDKLSQIIALLQGAQPPKDEAEGQTIQ